MPLFAAFLEPQKLKKSIQYKESLKKKNPSKIFNENVKEEEGYDLKSLFRLIFEEMVLPFHKSPWSMMEASFCGVIH